MHFLQFNSDKSKCTHNISTEKAYAYYNFNFAFFSRRNLRRRIIRSRYLKYSNGS